MQEDPTGQKYGRLEEEGGMGPDKVDSQLIFKTDHPTIFSCTLVLLMESPTLVLLHFSTLVL